MDEVSKATYFSHSTAVIEDGSDIGEGTSVWHFAHVRVGASIGRRCTLGKGVFVDANVQVGDDCKIQNGVSVYAGVTIENEVFVGPNVTFTNDRWPRAVSPTWKIENTLLRTGSSIGANATIICGTTIGTFAMVGAGSVVVRDVEDFELVVGNPARHAGWVCRCGRICSRESSRPETYDCKFHEISVEEPKEDQAQ